jgi:hypothetical protein
MLRMLISKHRSIPGVQPKRSAQNLPTRLRGFECPGSSSLALWHVATGVVHGLELSLGVIWNRWSHYRRCHLRACAWWVSRVRGNCSVSPISCAARLVAVLRRGAMVLCLDTHCLLSPWADAAPAPQARPSKILHFPGRRALSLFSREAVVLSGVKLSPEVSSRLRDRCLDPCGAAAPRTSLVPRAYRLPEVRLPAGSPT